MMKTNLKLSATYDGESVSTTFGYVNPNSTDQQLKTAAQALNSLTVNTYDQSDKIETTNLDNAVAKLTPSMTIDSADLPITRTAALAGKYVRVNYVGNGTLSIVNNDNTTWATTFRTNPTSGDLYLYMGIINAATETNATAPHDIVVRSDETDDYYAGELTFTITEG